MNNHIYSSEGVSSVERTRRTSTNPMEKGTSEGKENKIQAVISAKEALEISIYELDALLNELHLMGVGVSDEDAKKPSIRSFEEEWKNFSSFCYENIEKLERHENFIKNTFFGINDGCIRAAKDEKKDVQTILEKNIDALNSLYSQVCSLVELKKDIVPEPEGPTCPEDECKERLSEYNHIDKDYAFFYFWSQLPSWLYEVSSMIDQTKNDILGAVI